MGQSLWMVSNWEDHGAMEAMQHMFLQKDESIVGKSFDVSLLRMTGDVCKFVRRRLEVLDLSKDGEVALLGVAVKEDDGRALEVAAEPREFFRECADNGVVLRCARSDPDFEEEEIKAWRLALQDDESILKSLPVSLSFASSPPEYFEKFLEAVFVRFRPDIFFAIGKDRLSGRFRRMAFTRLDNTAGNVSSIVSQVLKDLALLSSSSSSSSCASSSGARWHYLPLYNLTLGLDKPLPPLRAGEDDRNHLFILPGDDAYSRRNAWEMMAGKTGRSKARAAETGFRQVCCFTELQEGGREALWMMVVMGPGGEDGAHVIRRRNGKDCEVRPGVLRLPIGGITCSWEEVETDSHDLMQYFHMFDGVESFIDFGEFGK